MSRDASIGPLAWADGKYAFRLAWGQLRELQEACDAGPAVVLGRLQGDAWLIQDISSTIRLGLIGGGCTPEKALTLVDRYVESRPPMENRMLAAAVLMAGLIGAPEDQPPKRQRRRTKVPA